MDGLGDEHVGLPAARDVEEVVGRWVEGEGPLLLLLRERLDALAGCLELDVAANPELWR